MGLGNLVTVHAEPFDGAQDRLVEALRKASTSSARTVLLGSDGGS